MNWLIRKLSGLSSGLPTVSRPNGRPPAKDRSKAKKNTTKPRKKPWINGKRRKKR